MRRFSVLLAFLVASGCVVKQAPVEVSGPLRVVYDPKHAPLTADWVSPDGLSGAFARRLTFDDGTWAAFCIHYDQRVEMPYWGVHIIPCGSCTEKPQPSTEEL